MAYLALNGGRVALSNDVLKMLKYIEICLIVSEVMTV